ncbi:MAG: hypothetical protein ABIH23_13350 [bacterium]
MTDLNDPHSVNDTLICHLLITPQRQVVSEQNQEILHVDTPDPIAIDPLRRWDKARRAQGRPPTLQEFIEAYWLGFGCVRWLAGIASFYSCKVCGKLIVEPELASHAEHCTFAVERKENNIPDPPEEIYLCPDEECGFWSTEYTDIRAPHRSKGIKGTHHSHSFILEDDPDIILDLWMRRYPQQVREISRCRLCKTEIGSGPPALDHFVQHHVETYSRNDILGELLNSKDPVRRKHLTEHICQTLNNRKNHELLVVFSPSFQRVYREQIAPAESRGVTTPDSLFKSKWVENMLDVISSYCDIHSPFGSGVNSPQSFDQSPALRISAKRPPISSLVNSHNAMKIQIGNLLRRLSGVK